MEARDRLRLLSLEMEMQRAWLAAYLDDGEVRAARHRRRRGLAPGHARRAGALAVARRFGAAAEWWRRRKARPALLTCDAQQDTKEPT